MWIALVCLYGVIKGMRDVIKKKAMERSSAVEVLFFYTLFSFVLTVPTAGDAFGIDYGYMWLIAVKSLVIFIAWICGFNAIKRLPVGLYGVMDMARVLISTAIGVVILGEAVTVNKTVGMLLVIIGLVLVNLRQGKGGGERTKGVYIALVAVSCIGNAVSGALDKVLMSGDHMTSGQLQFWYMLFLTVLYFGYILATRTKIDWKNSFKNYWIIILSVLFVIGDRALFIANSDPNSTVVTMTLIKQCSVLVTIIGGRLMFKEKRTLYKIACALVVIAGIVIAVV